MPATAMAFARESELAEHWAAGLRGPLRLEDGRSLRVVFPGHPGRGPGPDYRDALLDIGGDLVRGDVEFHLVASGWRTHGHHMDVAYDGVALHVVALNDAHALASVSASGRAVTILILASDINAPPFPPPFTPPCVFARANGIDPLVTLQRLSLRRLRMKSARILPVVEDAGAGQALYLLLLEQLGGSVNRVEFARIARRLPLPALIERSVECPGVPASRATFMAAELRGVAATLVLRRAGLRPLASPAKRLDAAGALFAWLWPGGAPPAWPSRLEASTPLPAVPGLGRSMRTELLVNAVLPVALAAGAWPLETIERSWLSLPSPGTYGKLRQLQTWLAAGDARPFPSAAHLQGGLLLHQDYCTRGMCGRCPLSS